jgi:hypothetical protein
MAKDDIPNVDLSLEVGDFLYQSDQELFLVVTGVNDDSYEFAVHGWREIADYRLKEYLDGDKGELFRQEDVSDVVENEREPDVQRKFKLLTDLFSAYEGGLDDEGPHTEFRLEDTDKS